MPPTDDPNYIEDEFIEEPAAAEFAEPEIDEDNRPLTRGEARKLLEAIAAQQQQAPAAGAAAADPYSNDLYNPAREARSSLRLIDTMITEVQRETPDIPVAILDNLRTELDKADTLEDLQNLQRNGAHIRYADAESMKAIKAGTYRPRQFATASSSAASSGGARPAAPTRTFKDLEAFPGEASMVEDMLRSRGTEFDQDDRHYLATGGTPR